MESDFVHTPPHGGIKYLKYYILTYNFKFIKMQILLINQKNF